MDIKAIDVSNQLSKSKVYKKMAGIKVIPANFWFNDKPQNP
jgi:hypothetical protein